MTICLYGSPISTFARKVAIGLELKGLPYDLIDALTPDRPSNSESSTRGWKCPC